MGVLRSMDAGENSANGTSWSRCQGLETPEVDSQHLNALLTS